MELSCPNNIFSISHISCKLSNVSKRPYLKMIPGRDGVHGVKRLRAVGMSDCGSCGGELLEMEEWSEMLKWGDKCRGSAAGVVELLECLEREAIMGEDEGREAVDYNRRAQIFDKSGRVFRELKHQAEDVENEDDNID